MLRAALIRSWPLDATAFRVSGLLQLPRQPARALATSQSKWYADNKGPEKIVFPGSSSQEAERVPAVPTIPASPTKPTATSTIPPENVPKAPPTLNEAQRSPGNATTANTVIPTGTGSASTASNPPTPPPSPKPKKGRVRRFFLFLITATGMFYAGGTYYSLHNDGFHDFFTEYVPLGEETVLFFEEREFKRRFPHGRPTSTGLYPQTSGENKVRFAGKSGLSARPADSSSSSSTSTTSGRKSDSAQTKKPTSGSDAKKKDKDTPNAKTAESQAVQAKDAQTSKKDAEKELSGSKPASVQTPASSSNTASAAPIALVDGLKVENAEDPVVQEVVKLLNDLITVVNADNGSGKFSSSFEKAKDDITKIAKDLATSRATETKAMESKFKELESRFQDGAKELMLHVQQEQQDQELRWREEYESERERLSNAYHEKLRSEMDAAQKVSDQRLQNELLEQDIKLKDGFTASIRDQVETERGGRLSKLNDLSSALGELEALTAKWNEVVDSNLRTQHLVVAVDAVRALLDRTNRPTPFLHELAALKEIANDDAVVNAAISSINPSSYQKGIPTSAQLIDRFRRVATEVRKAALLPEDAGVASHVASFVLSKVMFRKSGLATGDDVESILSRTETLLEEGHLDEATREMNGLAGWAKVLSKDWLADCRRVLEVRQAMDVISTEARLQSLLIN